MSTEYDPRLQALFVQAEKEFDHDSIAIGVLALCRFYRRIFR